MVPAGFKVVYYYFFSFLPRAIILVFLIFYHFFYYFIIFNSLIILFILLYIYIYSPLTLLKFPKISKSQIYSFIYYLLFIYFKNAIFEIIF